jgi:hypothetical protein
MKRYVPATLVALIAIALISWGVTGHRAVGKIAENHLSPKARTAVEALLGKETLADVATWADEVRGDAEYKHTGNWHFLNLPLGLDRATFEQKVKGMGPENVYGALLKCEHDVMDANTTKEEKAIALKFIVHFIGDLHQPMHISREEDKGGNTIQLNYEGKGTNLHSLWDTKLIEHQGLSYEQIAAKYDHIDASKIKKLQSDPMIQWVWESYEISSKLYAEVDAMKGKSIDQAYYDAHIGIIQDRIEMAGIRLAGVLNELFKDGTAPSKASAPAAAEPIKKTITVCEKVFTAKVMDGSEMTLLNLGAAYPNQTMTVMIKGEDRSKFKEAPEKAFKGKKICVTGHVIEYNGKPEIVVSDPSQIEEAK